MRKTYAAAAVAFGLAAAGPASAADDRIHFANDGGHRAAFAGLTLRLSLDGERPTPPVARLRLGMTRYDGQMRMLPDRGEGALELGLARSGRANLYFGGERVSDMGRRLGIAPGAAAAVAVAAVAVGAVAVSELSENDRYQCLLPEQELCGDPDGG